MHIIESFFTFCCPASARLLDLYFSLRKKIAAVILPSLQCLGDNSHELLSDKDKGQSLKVIVRNKIGGSNKQVDGDLEREDECGICLEPCTRMVLPNCCHAMCINCYRDWWVWHLPWFDLFQKACFFLSHGRILVFTSYHYVLYRNLRSASCPYCRGSLKRVNSGDLWVLTCEKEVADKDALLREETLRFYLYINSLPKDTPDALFLVYYEYLIWYRHKVEEYLSSQLTCV